MTGTAKPVRKRRVFYIPGFDPFPPRRYRELYREQSARQAQISGYEIFQSAGRGGAPFHWNVSAKIDGQAIESQIEVLVWSDLVQAQMARSIFGTYAIMLHTIWVYCVSGVVLRLFWLRKGPVIAAFYPVFVLIAQLAVAMASGLLVFAVVQPMLFAIVAGMGVFAGVMILFRRLDRKIYAYYLMQDYAFTCQAWGANPAVLDARLTLFAERILAVLDDPSVDEVLLVGHSSGAHLGVMTLAQILRDGPPQMADKLAFLSLGQVVPMQSFLPKASRLRGDLHLLAGQSQIAWVDVSAPGDGCCFALCDPVAVSGVAPEPQRWPVVVSAAFSETLSSESWKALRWRFFRLHFQYLCAFERPRDYDYFRITAGPLRLRDGLGRRNHSRSRITRVASKYQGMEP